MNGLKAFPARTCFAIVLLALAVASGPAACGSGEPSLSESQLPTPTVSGAIVFENAVKAGIGGNGDIYVVNADGSGLKALAEAPSWAEHPSWSPDGSQIVWATYPAGSEDGRDATLWVMNADGSGKRPLAEDLHGNWAVWSPDGTQIAFSRNEGMGEQDIYVIGADGSGLSRLTSGSGDMAPARGARWPDLLPAQQQGLRDEPGWERSDPGHARHRRQ